MLSKKRKSLTDIINEYFDSVQEWAEQFEESTMERPSWNLRECTFEPLREITVTPSEVIVTADLPLTEEGTVEVKPKEKNLIEISAKMKKKVRFEDFGVTHHRGEFKTFHCQMRIPVKVDTEKMHFTLKKGMLQIHLPRKS